MLFKAFLEFTKSESIGGKHRTIDPASDEDPRVGLLMNVIEKEFGIYRLRQRLIYGGKSLIDEGAKISSVGIKTGSKVMLIGKVGSVCIFESCFGLHCETYSTADNVKKSQNLEKADSVVLPAVDEKGRKRRKDLVNSFNDLIISAEQLQSELQCMFNASQIADYSK
ncbi:hypothetical protein TcWFU_001318 [Taenia crassiceps]|uniref:Ubiquitin-like domain-containing protein n=1 Tax=Taenia crassiceps TaxID=6207 RepID=A0ABR4QJU9_9CEST